MTSAMTATVLSVSERAGGAVQAIPRLEGLAALAAAATLYAQAGYSWRLFAVLFLVPDVGMLGYLAGPKVGAAAYNALPPMSGRSVSRRWVSVWRARPPWRSRSSGPRISVSIARSATASSIRRRSATLTWAASAGRTGDAMRVHAIQTGLVQIKASQVVGRGHGFGRRLAPFVDADWADWLPTLPTPWSIGTRSCSSTRARPPA